ncbi:MAG TPA: hypothetical protein VGK19_07985 [Capsulimonadaceae bacterium]|jgi:hypothetical protein
MKFRTICAMIALLATLAPLPSFADTDDAAQLTLGGYDVLTLHGSMGRLSARQRVDVLYGRLAPVLGCPVIAPDDVVVYAPAHPTWPVVFVLGRRFVTIDAATAKQEKLPAIDVAVKWAKRLQQVLPKVNWRPPDAAETVVPANPPLHVVDQLSRVGGLDGTVVLRGKQVIQFHGVQPGGLTAAERGDMVQGSLYSALARTRESGETPIVGATALEADGPAQLVVNGVTIATATLDMLEGTSYQSPAQLAAEWASKIQAVLGAKPASKPVKPTVDVPTEAAP